MEVDYDGRCFGCGPLNEDGLKLAFVAEGDVSSCEFRVPARYQSWKGVVHGGMIALILDEAIGWAAWQRGHPGVTGKLEVRYRHPLKVGEQIRVVGRITEVRRSLIRTSAYIERMADGVHVAEATGALMEVSVADPMA